MFKIIDWMRDIFSWRSKRIETRIKREPSQSVEMLSGDTDTQRERRPINIGIDFGTSSTKVIFRDIHLGCSHIVFFDHGLTGYPSFVLPSSVAVSQGRLYFGDRAERLEAEGRVLRSFKVCMACQSGLVKCRRCEPTLLQLPAPIPGWFLLSTETGTRVRVSACQLGTLYLAHVIRIVRRVVAQHIGRDHELHFTYNMGVPIDHLEDSPTKEVFARSLFLAEKLAGRTEQGFPLMEVIDLYDDLNASHPSLPSDEERLTFIHPETIAGIFSYAQSRVAEEGLYAIVDVGAGTTDVSFFRLADLPESERRLSIYTARTRIIGADNIDRAVFDKFRSHPELRDDVNGIEPGDILQRIRFAKEHLSRDNPISVSLRHAVLRMDFDEFKEVAAPIAQYICRHYRRTGSEAYKKEKSLERWRKYSFFLLGGGSRLEVLSSILRTPPAQIEEVVFREIPIPEDIGIGTRQEALPSGDCRLLAVAYGLSFHTAEIPKILSPSEVEPVVIYLPLKDIPGRDELYPKR